jgi:iron complex outermembrane receptor protein
MRIAPKPLALSLAIAAISVPVQAEQLTLEEVVVTAQKRVESLQDVPISIVAISGDKIEKSGFADLSQLSPVVPNFNVVQQQISDRVAIRGISSGGNQGFDQSVGLFSNGVYLARGTQFRSAFLDVGSVEILRGPQATLFGKNTIAGAVNITSSKPTSEFEAEIRASYETEYESVQTSGFVSGPLSDTLSARLAYKVSDDKGFIENLARADDEPASEADNYRLSFLWEPSDNLTVNLSYEKYNADVDSKGFEVSYDEDVATGATPGSIVVTPTCRYSNDCEVNGMSNRTNIDGSPGFTQDEFSDLETSLTSLKMDYQLGEYTLTAISGWSSSDLEEINAGNLQPIPLTNTHMFEEHNSFSQEFRIASPTGGTFEWLAGVYYESNDFKFEDNIHVHAGNVVPFLPTNVNIRTDFDQESSTEAAFAQTTWNTSDTLRITAGLRYSNDEKEAHQVYRVLEAGTQNDMGDVNFPNIPAAFGPLAGITMPGPAAVGAVFSFNAHDTGKQDYTQEDLSGNLNVQWDVTVDTMLYATTSIGYKTGGFDARLASYNGDPDQFSFEKEKATTYELGMKSALLNGSAEINAAVFYTEYEDLQFSAFNGGLSFVVDNAANAELQGVEFDGRWRVTENLTLSGGGAWLDFTYQDFPNGACDIYQTKAYTGSGTCKVDRSGERAPLTPEYSFNLSADWIQNLGTGMELELGADLIYEDDQDVAEDGDDKLVQDAFTKLNLRASLHSADDSWTLGLNVNNVTDEETIHYGNDVPLSDGARFVRPDAPRTVTITGTYRF